MRHTNIVAVFTHDNRRDGEVHRIECVFDDLDRKFLAQPRGNIRPCALADAKLYAAGIYPWRVQRCLRRNAEYIDI